MSGIGEFAYTVLLGWMRALVDWIWSLFSGRGGSDVWQWFLSNWKVWLLILLVGGLVVDWLLWVVRWRPYRVFLSRFRRAPAEGAEEEEWDNGVGYYEPETVMDADAPEWADTTFATLSEIDPNWTASIGAVIEEEPAAYQEDIGFEATQVAGFHIAPNVAPPQAEAAGYYEDDDDDLIWDGQEEVAPAPQPQPQEEGFGMLDAYTASYETYQPELEADDEDQVFVQEPPAANPYAAYQRQAPEPPVEVANAYEYDDYEEVSEETMIYQPEPEPEPQPVSEDTSPAMYGRLGMWPGAGIPVAPVKQEEAFDPLFNPDPDAPRPEDPPRRRRRRLHESVAEPVEPQPEQLPPQETPDVPNWYDRQPATRRVGRNGHQAPEAEPTRPERVVQPVSTEYTPEISKRKRGKSELQTVTGKPAKLRGLRKFMQMDEEPIAGLPPMDLTNPFLPTALPDNPDFEPDEGEEFYQ